MGSRCCQGIEAEARSVLCSDEPRKVQIQGLHNSTVVYGVASARSYDPKNKNHDGSGVRSDVHNLKNKTLHLKAINYLIKN